MLVQRQPRLDFWPVRVCLRHVVAGMGRKIVRVWFVVDQIELAIDYFEGIRVNGDGDRTGDDFASAIAAVLWGVFDGFARKHLLVLAAGEMPRRA